jgi:hypothetical protein
MNGRTREIGGGIKRVTSTSPVSLEVLFGHSSTPLQPTTSSGMLSIAVASKIASTKGYCFDQTTLDMYVVMHILPSLIIPA